MQKKIAQTKAGRKKGAIEEGAGGYAGIRTIVVGAIVIVAVFSSVDLCPIHLRSRNMYAYVCVRAPLWICIVPFRSLATQYVSNFSVRSTEPHE